MRDFKRECHRSQKALLNALAGESFQYSSYGSPTSRELNYFREANKVGRHYEYSRFFTAGIIAYESTMGYYIRVLGKKLDNIPLEELRQVSRPAVLHSEDESDAWERVLRTLCGRLSAAFCIFRTCCPPSAKFFRMN
jgi:hypothetical protein